MANLQKAIKGLECCYKSIEDCECSEDCPYKKECWDGTMYLDMMKDAHDLLKAQEPRVMTLEEVKAACRVGEQLTSDEKAALEEEGPVYMEFREEDGYKMHWRNRLDLRDWANGQSFERSYDVIYRCWTDRPTAEQKKAVAWNG